MSEDLIRRSDAIKAIEPYLDYIEIIPLCGAKPYVREAVCGIRSKIKFIPTIEPKRGEWINKIVDDVKITVCSNCDKEPTFTHYYGSCGNYSLSDFCPNCGAEMKGADDES